MYPSLMADLIGIDVTPDQSVCIASEHDFAGVDLRLTHYLDWLKRYGADRMVDHMREHNVQPGYASMLTRTLSAPEGEWGHMLERLPRIARLAQRLGYTRAGVVVLPYDDRLDFPANRKRHLNRLSQVAPVLADHGVRLGLEYVSPITRRADATFEFIHDMKAMRELIEDAGHANLGLMLDSFHWHCADENDSDLAKLSPDDVVVVHVNDAPKAVPTHQLEIRERMLPGETGVIDLDPFLRTIATIGYTGPVTAEPTNDRWPITANNLAAQLTSQAVRASLSRSGCAV